MNKVIVSAKTVEEAVEEALGRLEATRDQVRISVLEEPRRGWFGLFGARPAKVEVERIASPVNPVEQGLRFLKEVLSTMGLSLDVEVREEPEAVTFDLRGEHLGLIIGRRGQTLDALQYLVNIVANRGAETRHRFILDAGGFRERRRKTLQELADRLARQVLRTGKEVEAGTDESCGQEGDSHPDSGGGGAHHLQRGGGARSPRRHCSGKIGRRR